MKTMLRLLRAEWIKLKYFSSFWAFMGFFIIGLFGLNYFACKFYNNHIAVNPGGSTNNLFSFPEVWHTVTYLSGFLFFIPVLLIIILSTNEITFKTQRQSVVNGLTRLQYINVKFFLVAAFSFIFTFFVFVCCIAFGLYFKQAFSLNNSVYIIYFYLQCVCYSSLALLFAGFIKKTGLAIGSFVLYAWVIEKSVSGILNGMTTFNLGNYLPLSSSDKLISIPFGNNSAINSFEARSILLLLFSIGIYLFSFYAVAAYKAKNVDL